MEPELEEYLAHGATHGSVVAKVLPDRAADTMAPDGSESVEAQLDWRPEQDAGLFDELVEGFESPTEVVFSAPGPSAPLYGPRPRRLAGSAPRTAPFGASPARASTSALRNSLTGPPRSALSSRSTQP
ncbi:hypothetical protein [Streptomyces sirii]|uniref:hypothetical protein n=1 Tax=Streptomyces sirii TaxID=3127701 RepID=UPI003D35C99F